MIENQVPECVLVPLWLEVNCFRLRCSTNFFLVFFLAEELLTIDRYENSDWCIFFTCTIPQPVLLCFYSAHRISSFPWRQRAAYLACLFVSSLILSLQFTYVISFSELVSILSYQTSFWLMTHTAICWQKPCFELERVLALACLRWHSYTPSSVIRTIAACISWQGFAIRVAGMVEFSKET